MNITICVILVVIAVLEVGQAITLNKKINMLDGQMKDLKRTTEGIDIDILDNHMKMCSLTGKCEEINQRSKEGFQVNLNHLLQLRQSAFDLEVNSNENRDKINAAIRQESAKNIMLHVRGVKNGYQC